MTPGLITPVKVMSVDEMADRIEELDAKLAKAEEDSAKWLKAFSAQSRKLQEVLHIEGVKDTLAELKGEK